MVHEYIVAVEDGGVVFEKSDGMLAVSMASLRRPRRRIRRRRIKRGEVVEYTYAPRKSSRVMHDGIVELCNFRRDPG